MSATYVKTNRRFRNKKTAALSAVAFFAIAGCALAAWLVMSRGSGTAGIGSLNAPVVTQAAPEQPYSLFPGGTGPGNFTVNNPNAAMFLTDARASTLNAQVDSDNPACLGGGYLQIVPQTGLHIPIPNGTSIVRVPGFYALAANTPSECQGALMWADGQLTFSTS